MLKIVGYYKQVPVIGICNEQIIYTYHFNFKDEPTNELGLYLSYNPNLKNK